MAGVGPLRSARITLQVSRAVLPRYRSRFCKRRYAQPQLLAFLCLMRHEDWTFREAERHAFPHRTYGCRALIESLFSSVKRKFSAPAPGRALGTQQRKALLLGLSFNLYRLKHRRLFQRMSTEPDGF